MRSSHLMAALFVACSSFGHLVAQTPADTRSSSSAKPGTGQVHLMANDQQGRTEAWVTTDRGFINLQESDHGYAFLFHVDGRKDLRVNIPKSKDGSVLRIEASFGSQMVVAEPHEMAGGASALQSLLPSEETDLLLAAVSMVKTAPNGTKGLDGLQLMATGVLGHMIAPYQAKVQTMEMPWDYAAYAVCYWACVGGGGGSSRWISCGDNCRAEYL